MAIPVGDSYSVASGGTIYGGRSSGVAATALTITDFADLTHYQRDQTGLGKTINVTIQTTGSPSRIEWRAVDYYSGVPINSWSTLVNNPGASATVPLYMPASFWAKIEVRDSINTALTHSTTTRMSVGIKWGWAGQSNVVNRLTTASGSPTGSRQCLIAGRVTPKRLGNINDSIPASSPSTTPGYSTGLTIQTDVRGDALVYFANILSAALGMTVMIIERATSGSNIDNWMSDAGSKVPWTDFAAAVTAQGGDIEGCTWHQGETNANTMSRATRLTKMAQLHGQMHTLTGRNASTFKFGITTIGPGPYIGSSDGEFGTIREADNWYARNTAGAFLAASAHNAATPADSVHIDGEGFGRIGRVEAKSAIAAYGIGVSGAGPRITSMARSGTTVDVSIVHSGGTALTDGAGGSGSALTGFQFTDAGAGGAAIAVTGSTILNATTIRLTLASTPVGALTGSYAMSDVPHGVFSSPGNTFVPASTVCDNALYLNSSVGCVLQPYAPTLVS